MKIMKTVVLCLFLMSTCFAVDNTSTESEQPKVQKREKQFEIEDDTNKESEQKKDKGTSIKNINNVDSKGNPRIINIRIQPNLVTGPIKQALNPVLQKPTIGRIDKTPQRIPTKIPVVLKTTNVIPSPAHALRHLENSNKDICPPAPPILSKPIPYFTIEDRPSLKMGNCLCPSKVDDETKSCENNIPLKKNGKQTSDKDGNKALLEKNNDSLHDSKKDQVCLNADREATSKVGQKPKSNEPEINKQYKSEDKAVAINIQKEISITKNKQTNINKKCVSRKKFYESDDESDPDIVRIINGTHIITIEKSPNQDKNRNEQLDRNGAEPIPRTVERMINKEPPKPKTVADKPEKCAVNVKNKENVGIGLNGLVINTNNCENDQSDYITITGGNYEDFKENSPNSAIVTIEVSNTPTKINEGNQEPNWNYLQNPYYKPYYQNVYDQYRMAGLRQNVPNVYGQECHPRNYGELIEPGFYRLDPPIIEPYYPNGYPPVDDKSDIYCPNELEIETTIWPDNCPDDSSDISMDVEGKNRNGQPYDIEELDIDIRRFMVPRNDGFNDDVIGKVANPYASLPVNLNGGIYTYLNPACRYVR